MDLRADVLPPLAVALDEGTAHAGGDVVHGLGGEGMDKEHERGRGGDRAGEGRPRTEGRRLEPPTDPPGDTVYSFPLPSASSNGRPVSSGT